MNADFVTKEVVNMKLRELDQGVKMDMMTKTMFNEWRTGIEDRIYDNNESIFACKKAL